MAETLLIHIVWHFMVLQTEVTAIIGRMKILKRFLTSSPYKITMEKRATKQLSSSGNSYVNPRLFLRPDHIWRSSFHLSMLPLQFFTNLCPPGSDETSLRKAGRAVASPLLAMHREDNDGATSKRTDESYQNSAPNQIEISRDKSSATI